MKWIPVEHAVPTDRRRVLVWCEKIYWLLPTQAPFALISRCNLNGDGHRFDCEDGNPVAGWIRVTHWAEIEGPA